MIAALQVTQIIISLLLIGVVLLQVRIQGLGTLMGGATATQRVRRGFEKTLFQFTIALAVFFVVISLVSVVVAK